MIVYIDDFCNFLPPSARTQTLNLGLMRQVIYHCATYAGVDTTIEIGLEQAPFFSSFEHVKSLQIMGPINTKTVHKSVILSCLTMKILKFDSNEGCFMT